MQTLAFNIVLENTAALKGSVQANTDDAAAEEAENNEPLHDCPACALSLDLGEAEMTTMLACYFDRSTPCTFDFLR